MNIVTSISISLLLFACSSDAPFSGSGKELNATAGQTGSAPEPAKAPKAPSVSLSTLFAPSSSLLASKMLGHVPSEARHTVVLGDLGALATTLKLEQWSPEQRAALSELSHRYAALDLFDGVGLQTMGIDPRQGLAYYEMRHGLRAVVVGVGDAKALEKALSKNKELSLLKHDHGLATLLRGTKHKRRAHRKAIAALSESTSMAAVMPRASVGSMLAVISGPAEEDGAPVAVAFRVSDGHLVFEASAGADWKATLAARFGQPAATTPEGAVAKLLLSSVSDGLHIARPYYRDTIMGRREDLLIAQTSSMLGLMMSTPESKAVKALRAQEVSLSAELAEARKVNKGIKTEAHKTVWQNAGALVVAPTPGQVAGLRGVVGDATSLPKLLEGLRALVVAHSSQGPEGKRVATLEKKREATEKKLQALSTDALTGIGMFGNADFSSSLEDKDVYGGLLGKQVGMGDWHGSVVASKESYSGANSGGGGRVGGEAITGLGRIAHGSSSISSRGKARTLPKVSIGTGTSVGLLEPSVIRRIIDRRLGHLRYCYEKELRNDQDLSGTVRVSFTISARGRPTVEKSSGLHPKVDSCVGAVVGRLIFPKPTDGKVASVTYPISFAPK